MKLDEFEITRIINTVEKGVSSSWVGDVFTFGGSPDKPQKQVNQVAYQVYLTVLTSILNKMEPVEIIHAASPSHLELN